MRPVSAKLAGIVSSTHVARCRVRTVLGFPTSTNPTAGAPLLVVGGHVEMDSTAEVRSTLDLEVMAPWGTLLPDGTELFVEYGVEISGGQFEWISLGYFRIDEVTQDELDGPLRVTGSDRMAQVTETENMFSTVSVPRTTTDFVFYNSLLYANQSVSWMNSSAGVFPSGTTGTVIADYDLTSKTTGYKQPLSEDTYYTMMKTRAERTSKRLYFDYLGRLTVVSDAVVAKAVPDLRVVAGPRGQLSRVRRQVTRRGVYTSTRVTGTQSTEGDPPWGWQASGGASLPNPAPDAPSWYGKFGRILDRFSSPLLTDTAACDEAGRTRMAKIQGLPRGLSFEMIPNPALEALDTIEVTWPEIPASYSGSLKNTGGNQVTTEKHVVDRLRFPLTGGPMEVTTRGSFIKVP